MLYYFKKGKNTKKICIVYGEDAVTDQMCSKWFAKFHATDFSLDNAAQLGRAAEVGSDQIKTLIENNDYTMWETVNILKTSKSIKVLVKMYLLFCGKNHTDFLANPIF